MVKVSVVIPVYNVEEFLKPCLDSIVNQTLKDIEIICVNDGSKDKSLDILNFYAENDDRFTVISQENGGHAVATNRGMKLAKGEYLFLMDSDDLLDLSALEKTYYHAEKTNADFVMFQSWNYASDEDKIYKTEIYSMNEVADFIGNSTVNYKELGDLIFKIPVTPWSKLYNNQFVKDCGATFPEGLVFDDNIFFWEVLFNAERIAFYKEYFFTRRWYSYSSTTAGDQRFLDSIDIHNLMIDTFKKYGAFEQYKERLYNRKLNMGFNRFNQIKPEFKEMYFNKFKKDLERIVSEGLYDDYINHLDDRNTKIFQSFLDSKTPREVKFEMADRDTFNTLKRVRKEKEEIEKELKLLKDENKKLLNLNSKNKEIKEDLKKFKEENRELTKKNQLLLEDINSLRIANEKSNKSSKSKISNILRNH